MTAKKDFYDMSKKERVKLMLEDSQAYMDLVPPEHWLLLLDGIAKVGPMPQREDLDTH